MSHPTFLERERENTFFQTPRVTLRYRYICPLAQGRTKSEDEPIVEQSQTEVHQDGGFEFLRNFARALPRSHQGGVFHCRFPVETAQSSSALMWIR